MKNKLIKTGLLAAFCFSLTGMAAQASYAQTGSVCKVTKRSGASIYVASLDKYFRIRRGGTMIVVDPEPHQGTRQPEP